MSDASGDWKTVWITGASTGIGYALAQQISAPNRTVALSARSKDKLAELESQSDGFVAYPMDVSDAKAVADSVENIEQRHGPIDLAVLNAGTWSMISARDFDLETIRRGFEVNYMGVIERTARGASGHVGQKERSYRDHGIRGWLSRVTRRHRLQPDQSGADQSGRNTARRIVSPGHHNLPGQPRVCRYADDAGQPVPNASDHH